MQAVKFIQTFPFPGKNINEAANASTIRITSIDALRGIAMIIMALDHLRDYLHITSNINDPLDLATTTPLLFLTRWVTHFCAPIFVFLTGLSIYLQSCRKTKKQLSTFLIKRGLWLIFVECVIISFAWTFLPALNVIILQVIWAIGISMVLLGLIIYLPYRFILTLGLVIVFGHNLLDIPESAPDFKAGFWWDLLHHGHFTSYKYADKYSILIVYPFVAWTGVMMLGYCAGALYTPAYTQQQRMQFLSRLAVVLIGLFVILRFSNVYGDPHFWQMQKSPLLTLFSFINVNKYPPSLLYLCITIGPALLVLSLIEKTKSRYIAILLVFGRTAFFYYILHLYFIHLLATISFFIKGHTLKEALESAQHLPFLFQLPGVGWGLAMVYVVWILSIILLYPVCKWYDRYKTAHKEKWWLSYL